MSLFEPLSRQIQTHCVPGGGFITRQTRNSDPKNLQKSVLNILSKPGEIIKTFKQFWSHDHIWESKPDSSRNVSLSGW